MMGVQITTNGSDDLSRFVAHIPGHCTSCGNMVDISVKYNATSFLHALRGRNIDVKKTASLVIKSPWEIGITCGCYAKLHRQIAHISDARRTSRKG